jgi:DNA-binding response OmpR family regulator
MSRAAALPTVLLIEPQFVLRRTIVAVAHDLRLADFREATSVEAARPLLAAQSFDAIVLDIDIGDRALALLSQLRQGAFASQPHIALVATTQVKQHALREAQLRELEGVCILLKPFKVAELLERLQRVPVRQPLPATEH